MTLWRAIALCCHTICIGHKLLRIDKKQPDGVPISAPCLTRSRWGGGKKTIITEKKRRTRKGFRCTIVGCKLPAAFPFTGTRGGRRCAISFIFAELSDNDACKRKIKINPQADEVELCSRLQTKILSSFLLSSLISLILRTLQASPLDWRKRYVCVASHYFCSPEKQLATRARASQAGREKERERKKRNYVTLTQFWFACF